MWKQAIISISIFEAYYWGIDVLSKGGLQNKGLLFFNMAFVIWLAMEAFRVRLGHKDNSRTFGFISRMFLLVSFLSIALGIYDIALLSDIKISLLPDNSYLLGLILLAIGVYLRHISIKTLGRFFVTKVQVTDDHELVKKGIYRVLRHPSYTGLIAGFLGAILMLSSDLALLLFLGIGIPAYLYRIWIEEQALIRIFGDEYIQYKLDTYAILPYIY